MLSGTGSSHGEQCLMDYLEIKQVFGALVIAKLLSVPMVMAYHTHVPM